MLSEAGIGRCKKVLKEKRKRIFKGSDDDEDSDHDYLDINASRRFKSGLKQLQGFLTENEFEFYDSDTMMDALPGDKPYRQLKYSREKREYERKADEKVRQSQREADIKVENMTAMLGQLQHKCDLQTDLITNFNRMRSLNRERRISLREEQA